MTRGRIKRIMRWSIVCAGIIIVLGYAGFAFRDLVRGPNIVITEPTDGETFATSTVTIKGVAMRVQHISLNGRQILIDEQGSFNEFLLLFSGYNVAMIQAEDRFGHIETKKLQLIYKPEETR